MQEAAVPMDVSLVIPAYNESAIVLDTIRAVSARLAELAQDYEVLIVDDGSTDGMAELVRGCGDPRVRLEGYASNRGKGCAVRTGMLAAKGDVILCTDADLAYGVDVFAVILDRFRAGDASLVIGSRRIGGEGYKNYPPLRILMSKCFGLLSHMISGLPYDTQCGIKGYRGADLFPLHHRRLLLRLRGPHAGGPAGAEGGTDSRVGHQLPGIQGERHPGQRPDVPGCVPHP